MMKFYKIIFVNSMILGTMVAISSYSWIGMWLGLEINLLSIIPLFSSTKNSYSSEAALKYFISQTIASLILLISIVLMLSLNEFVMSPANSTMMMMMNSAFLIKLGTAPFHFWFPEVMEGLTWNNCLILLTGQKIAPMILIMNNSMNLNFMFTIVVFSLIVSTFMSFNQISLRKILAFSSINHMAWMISTMLFSFSVWMIYLLIYCLITFNIVMMFNQTNSFYFKQTLNLANSNKLFKLLLYLNFLSLGGIPPFIGFLPKWLAVSLLVSKENYFLPFVLIVFTLIMLFIYIRLMFSPMMIFQKETKLVKINFSTSKFIFISMTSLMSLIWSTYLFNFL
uniref:NADH-ubiquinone oxidoreductase chain 2 n=1 Tax=Prostomis sp. PRO01 TaxID=1205644 RepID=A0A0S2MQ16_9CUCU|nr:NADH deshydrogenase subunit 2 [Prostomis sp. PRO01]